METIRNNLVYYWSDGENEGRICLFNSFTCSVEEIAKFHNYYEPYQVATTQNKVNSYVRYFEQFLEFQIFGNNYFNIYL